MSRFPRLVPLFAAALTLPGLVLAGDRPLTPEDLIALAGVGDPQISPDGNLVAYTIARTDLDEDESETALWAAPTGEDEPWRMTAPGYSASRPRWSPDGRRLAFLSSRSAGDEDSRTQVWAFDLRGGDAEPLTEVEQGVDSFAWSPDGNRLLLTIQDPKPEDLLDESEKADYKPEPHVIDRLQFKRDYSGYLDRRRTHLYVLDLDDDELVQITSGDFDDSGGTWSPDGSLIAFSSNRTDEPDGNDNSDLWVVSSTNSDEGRTLSQVTTNEGGDDSPAWSPDGSSLAYVTGRSPELLWYSLRQPAVVDLESRESRLLSPGLDRNVSSPQFTPDGRSVLYRLTDSGAGHLAAFPAGGGEPTRPVAGDRSVRSFSQSDDGRVAFLASEPHLPPEIFLAPGTRQLTDTNRELLDQVALGRVENIHFTSADGTPIEGFVTFPVGYDERLSYPTILWIHGGPVSQYDFSFNAESQLFAANGYVVVRVNPRGSSGYGEDFSAEIFADWGNKDFQDVMAGIDYAIEQGWTDAERLGVGGWSYGGILTNYVITQTDRFQAAISGASEVLYVANYGHDHYQRDWERELGLPWETRDVWERLSPFNKVQNIVTPTLILGGALDWNVPVLNSEQLYQALKRLGRTTQLIVYPGEHHGIRKPTFRQDRWERYLAWFERYAKGIEPVEAPTE